MVFERWVTPENADADRREDSGDKCSRFGGEGLPCLLKVSGPLSDQNADFAQCAHVASSQLSALRSSVRRIYPANVLERCAVYQRKTSEFREGVSHWGGEARPQKRGAGVLKAFDLSGRQVLAKTARYPIVGSVLSTGGGMVFVGHPTGEFAAYGAQSGQELWHFATGSGIRGGPITYTVKGKQYLAVPSGWGGWLKGFAPELYAAPRGMTLYVFALP